MGHDSALAGGDIGEILGWIAAQQPDMCAMVEAFSRINSGSTHVAGLACMAGALEQAFAPLNVPIARVALNPMMVVGDNGLVTQQPLGEMLHLSVRPDAPYRVLLVGHYDTVFGADHPFQQPYWAEDGTMHGPGVADLKGGLVVMLTALRAFEQSPLAANIGWEVILNPDEEIGSIGSAPHLAEAAKRAQIGLVFEPALPDGTLAGARKGSGNFTLTVHGRAAHAGRNPEEGRNALVAAAQAALALAALNGKRASVTINPARLISGGALNVVPDLAVLKWNVRVTQPEDAAWVSAQMEEIAAGLEKDGITATLSGHFTRPPKPMCTRNRALFDWVVESGAMLGQTLSWRDTGGACDGNNLHASGLATVDTLGVRGGHIHSDAEYMVPESLTERAQLAALLLLRLAKGERPQFPS